jgi:hypothetical protein
VVCYSNADIRKGEEAVIAITVMAAPNAECGAQADHGDVRLITGPING